MREGYTGRFPASLRDAQSGIDQDANIYARRELGGRAGREERSRRIIESRVLIEFRASAGKS